MARKTNGKQVSDEKKRAAIYCRVSTFMQGAADYSSLNAQEDQLRAFCKGKDWEVAGVYKDTKSGGTLDRAELNNLLQDAEGEKFDVIVVTKIDRLSRSMIDFKNVTKQFYDLGLDFVSSTQNIDTTTSGGKFMQDIFVAFAEFERNMISERTRESLYQRAKQGHWGGGNAPLGFDVVNKKLEINATEAELVNKIFDYYVENQSTLEVARR
ncbi:MAG: recombinase family protein [Bacteroidota bacterium]